MSTTASGSGRPLPITRWLGVCDSEHCECGGQLKIVAAIEDPVAIVKMLTHRGLPARAPPRALARALPLIPAA